jgi:hypothetical protein
MLWGHLGQRDAARLVRRGYEPDDRDVARYCTAGGLRAVGFVVDNTPTRWNPDHVSVSVPGGASAWDDLHRALFAHVFAWHDEGGT